MFRGGPKKFLPSPPLTKCLVARLGGGHILNMYISVGRGSDTGKNPLPPPDNFYREFFLCDQLGADGGICDTKIKFL